LRHGISCRVATGVFFAYRELVNDPQNTSFIERLVSGYLLMLSGGVVLSVRVVTGFAPLNPIVHANEIEPLKHAAASPGPRGRRTETYRASRDGPARLCAPVSQVTTPRSRH
jgi:hypothetical protein